MSKICKIWKFEMMLVFIEYAEYALPTLLMEGRVVITVAWLYQMRLCSCTQNDLFRDIMRERESPESPPFKLLYHDSEWKWISVVPAGRGVISAMAHSCNTGNSACPCSTCSSSFFYQINMNTIGGCCSVQLYFNSCHLLGRISCSAICSFSEC